MYRVLACLTESHDPWLLVISGAICFMTAGSTFLVLDRARAAQRAKSKLTWTALAGLTAGGGAWATHFIAVLAFDPGMPFGFDFGWMLASALVGVAGAFAALLVHESRKGGAWPFAAGSLLGLSIVGLHFVGMIGFEAGAARSWSWDLVAASVILGAGVSTLALLAYDTPRVWLANLGAPLLLVFAVFSLHLTGMAALTLTPVPGLATSAQALDRASMTLVIAMGAGAVLTLAFVVAIADRRIAAVRLEQAARYRRLADAAIEGIVIHDRAHVIDVNARFESMIDRSVSQLRGGEIRQFFTDETWLEFQTALDQCGESILERQITWDGAANWVEIHTRPLNSAQNTWISSVRDISARRRADAAEAANAAKSQFVANMSHELRTPLNAIIGYAEMLEEEGQDRGDRIITQDAGRITASARHLLSLINEILDLSKIEAGKMEMEIGAIDIASTVRDAAETVRPIVEANGNRFELVIDGEPGDGIADEFRLKQCLLNLASNAAKFTKNGRVGVRVRRIGASIEIAVADSGVGMTREQASQLFQPFTQADASVTRKFGGTGLGLAITKRLMEMMGGDVRVKTALGRGSVFTLVLPVAEAQRAAA